MYDNSKLTFIQVAYQEGYKGGKRWQSIDFIFFHEKFKDIRHKFFAPQTYKDRRELSDKIEHIFEVLGEDYNSIEYQNDFLDLQLEISSKLSKHYNEEFYGKLINKPAKDKDRVVLGSEIPFLSNPSATILSSSNLIKEECFSLT